MAKFVRLVFEEEVPDDAQIPEMMNMLVTSIENWLKHAKDSPIDAFEDIEISEYPYERQE